MQTLRVNGETVGVTLRKLPVKSDKKSSRKNVRLLTMTKKSLMIDNCTDDSEQSVATPNSRQEVLYQPKFETTPRAIESSA